jgi:hypothetical protein
MTSTAATTASGSEQLELAAEAFLYGRPRQPGSLRSWRM